MGSEGSEETEGREEEWGVRGVRRQKGEKKSGG